MLVAPPRRRLKLVLHRHLKKNKSHPSHRHRRKSRTSKVASFGTVLRAVVQCECGGEVCGNNTGLRVHAVQCFLRTDANHITSPHFFCNTHHNTTGQMSLRLVRRMPGASAVRRRVPFRRSVPRGVLRRQLVRCLELEGGGGWTELLGRKHMPQPNRNGSRRVSEVCTAPLPSVRVVTAAARK